MPNPIIELAQSCAESRRQIEALEKQISTINGRLAFIEGVIVAMVGDKDGDEAADLTAMFSGNWAPAEQ